MKQAAPAAQDLARRLLTLEAGADNALVVHALLRTFEKLRVNLTKMIGGAGFQALLTRALALAQLEAAWLTAVQVEPKGMLAGFEENAHAQSPEEAMEGGTVLLAQILGLLILFVGEALTFHILHDIWSEIPWENKSGVEGISE